jgi:hypothetical protein
MPGALAMLGRAARRPRSVDSVDTTGIRSETRALFFAAMLLQNSPPMSLGPVSWKSMLVVVSAAALTVILADWSIQRVVPTTWLRQVAEGVSDLERSNPVILSLSSSHGRSMDAVAAELGRRSGDPGRMISITMEAGKATHFEYVLEHRLKPLLEERRADGSKVRDRLQRFILLTEWWDSCTWPADRPDVQLQGHAWTLPDFVDDALEHGIVPQNRNYVRWQFKRVLKHSTLLQNRGGIILTELTNLARGRPLGRTPEEEQAFTEWWQHYNEDGAACMLSPAEMQAYSNIVDYAQSQGLDVTIMIFAAKPNTLTPQAIATTFTQYSAAMRDFAHRKHARFIDISTSSPLTDQDFKADFDHVNASGNEKLSKWLLDGELSFLSCESGAGCSALASQR